MPESRIYTPNRNYPLVRKASSPSEQRDWMQEQIDFANAIDADTELIDVKAIAAGATAETAQTTADAAQATANQAQLDADAATLNANQAKNEAAVNTLERTSRIAATLEWSGFSDGGDNSSIVVTYDNVARTITLSGSFVAYYKGELVAALISGWTSPAHVASPTGTLFLKFNGGGFTWSYTPWSFHELQIAYVCVNAAGTVCFAQREPHGFMPWLTHKRIHTAIGTTRESGGDSGGYVLGSTTAANRRPTTTEALELDEDLATILPAHATKADYAQVYLDGASGNPIIAKSQAEIVELSGSTPLWNEFTGGVWTKTALSNNSFMNVYQIALPVTADSFSQLARFAWMAGQAQYSTLAFAQVEPVTSLNLGLFGSLSPEFVFITKVTLKYVGGNWTIEYVERLEGSRAQYVGSPAGAYLTSVSSDVTHSGDGTPGSPLANSGIDRTRAVIAGASDTVLVTDTTIQFDLEQIGDDIDVLVNSTVLAVNGFNFTIERIGADTGYTIRIFETAISGDPDYTVFGNEDRINDFKISDGNLVGKGFSI